MAINKQGVEQLKADMRANVSAYKQDTFGRLDTECGTTQCMAGFCLQRKIGEKEFLKKVGSFGMMDDTTEFYDACELAGRRQLGIKLTKDEIGCKQTPTIFEYIGWWPSDLRRAYEAAQTPAERVEVACAALDRLNPDGSIKKLDEVAT